MRKIRIISATVDKCATCFSDLVSKTAKNQVEHSTGKKSPSIFQVSSG